MRGWIGTVLAAGVFAAVQIAAAEGSQGRPRRSAALPQGDKGARALAARPAGEMRIEREVAAACREIDEGQATLSDRCSLADYRALVRAVNGTNMWTAALQKALDEHEIVTIPASDEKYFFDGTVVVPSRRRIEAKGATIRLADGMRTVLLRNASAQDGTLAPIPASAKRDTDIAIVGGRWEDCCTRRAGYGRTGMFNLLPRRKGNYFGVSTLFFFNNVNRLSVTGATFHHTGGFAVQAGDGDAVAFRDISFDRCFADGLHLNGNLTRVLARNVRGQVGDDLVALNAYDWLNSSVNFGPQRYILCEDLELVRLPGVSAYPAIRIQPAKYRYADGSIVDCAISDVIFRRVKGITTYKMYLQTPRYTIGSTPEWAEVGSGGNLFFSDLEIDLDAPIDKIGQYATQEAPRGHFAAFEFGANLSLVHFKNIDITFHADRWPLTHLVQVGPKSCFYPGKDGKPGTEIFDPYVSCRVERVVLENVRVHGTPPAELVYSAAFDDINKDGRSTGRGVIEKIVEARGTGDVARVKGTDGVWREVPLVGVREADGGVRYTFPAAEARKAQVVQFWLDRAQAKTGEEGFWMGGRGVVGHFTRPKMRWVNGAQFMDHPYFAMQTPRGAFIAIVEASARSTRTCRSWCTTWARARTGTRWPRRTVAACWREKGPRAGSRR